MTSEITKQAMATVADLLELTATERPERLDLLLDTLLNSPMRFAVRNLASTFDVPRERLAATVHRTCQDLDRLLATRRVWSDPRLVLESANVAALYHICHARLGRTTGPKRSRLEITFRRLSKAHDLFQSRQWIEAFIGRPLPTKSTNKPQPADH